MTGTGVILFGGPAAGKDTVTAALTQVDPNVQLFRRLKAGPGRTTGYRIATLDHVAQLRDAGQVIWENHRYSSTYVVDRGELDRMIAAELIPVVHLGQTEAVDRLYGATDISWTVVELWCPRPIAAERIQARATGDAEERLQAWKATGHLSQPDLFIDTSRTPPAATAAAIRQRMYIHHD